jgi:hypothetical protein
MNARLLPVLAFLAVAAPGAAQGQFISEREESSRPVRFHFGGGLNVAQPRGEFAEYVNVGAGFGLHGRADIGQPRILSIRADLGMLEYGKERTSVNFPGAPRIRIDVNTANRILTYSIGPQLTLPSGAIRPYVNAAIGGSRFFTESSMEGAHADEQVFTTEHFADNIVSRSLGGGVYVPLRTQAPVMIDLGVRYFANGTTSYLRKGSIEDRGDHIVITPIRSETRMLLWYIGVSVGLRPQTATTD